MNSSSLKNFMKIVRGETPNFEEYEVRCRQKGQGLLSYFPPREIKLTGVLEADDTSGRVVRQVVSVFGHPVYSNGPEDIFIDNTVKILLLVPPIREAFVKSGFRPKVIISFEEGVRIINKDPSAALRTVENKLVTLESINNARPDNQ